LDNDEELVAVFGWRSAYLTFKTLQQSQGKTRNQLQVAMWKLTTAHSQFLVVRGFYERLVAVASTSELQLSPETRDVLWKLFRLYALFLIQSEPYDFFASSALQTEQLEHASTVMFMQLLADIRPHAVKLVDSWNLPDWLLDSSLGRYDGRVYEDLFQRASQSNPLNLITVDPRPGSSTMIKNEIVNRSRSNL
jgi:acyl-CoA oxidase